MGFLDLVRIPQSRDRYRVGPFRSIPVFSLKGDAKMKTKDLKQPNASISQNDFIEPRCRHDPMLVLNMSIFNSDRGWNRIFNLLSQRENVWY